MARPQAPRGEGRHRVVSAALELFALNGVAGTSLQNIADHLGVQKSAVYYQFKAKRDILIAVLEPAIDALHVVVSTAEQERGMAARSDSALVGLVDLVVSHRQIMSTLFSDPEAQQLIGELPEVTALIERVAELILGPRPSIGRRIAGSVFGGGITHAGTDPTLGDITDDQMRTHLIALGRRLLQ